MATEEQVWFKKLNGLPPLSIATLCTWVGNDKSLNKGYKFFIEDYLFDIWVKADDEKFTSKAKCHRSQRKNEKPHDLNLQLSADGNVFASECSCKAG